MPVTFRLICACWSRSSSRGRSTISRTTNPAPGIPTVAASDQTASPARTLLWPAVAALLAIVAVALAFLAFRPEPETTTTRFSISLPPGQEITSGPAISDDGRIIAYTAQLGTAESQLYLRRLDSFEARLVEGSSGARLPFFSPDGQWVAFFAQGQLQKAEVAGSTPVELAEAAYPKGGPGIRTTRLSTAGRSIPDSCEFPPAAERPRP